MTMMLAAQPQATWIKDGERWAVLVPPDLAKPGQRVEVERVDGTRRREVTIGTVTARTVEGQGDMHVD